MGPRDVRGNLKARAGEVARPAARRRLDRSAVERECKLERITALARHRLHESRGRRHIIAGCVSVVREGTSSGQAAGTECQCSKESASISVNHSPAPCCRKAFGSDEVDLDVTRWSVSREGGTQHRAHGHFHVRTPTTSYLEAHAKGRACPKCAPALKYGASLRSLVRRPCDFNY